MNKQSLLMLFAGCLLSLGFIFPANAAWQTKVINSTQYPRTIYTAWTQSTSDSSVFLTVSCERGQRNATVTVTTSNSIVGSPNTTYETVYFTVGRGDFGSGASYPSQGNGRIAEGGTGFYLATQYQALSVNAMIINNDWMKVYWSFQAPTRGKLMQDLLGKPTATPQRQYTFDLRGYRATTTAMAAACQW